MEHKNERRRKAGRYNAYAHPGNYIVTIFNKVRKGVVFIRALKKKEEPYYLQDPFAFYPPNITARTDSDSLGIGTGFVVNKKGLILTSEHIINNAEQISIKVHNGKSYPGKVIWTDEEKDIALLAIDNPRPPALIALALGSSRRSKDGEMVASIGNPLGLESSITSGVISRRHHSFTISDREMKDIIQTDCAINPGSSGGPLINLKGQVIGMNAFMAKNKQGLGFALGIDDIKNHIRTFLK